MYQMGMTVGDAPECLGTPGEDTSDEEIDKRETAFWTLQEKVGPL